MPASSIWGAAPWRNRVVVPEHAAALKPASLDFVQAASIPMVALTAWQAFTEQAPLAPGQRVFIPAGSGGIGSFAIQLAKHLGALVATSTSTANAEWVGQLGAEVVVDYKRQAFDALLQGYDLVLGTLRGDAIERSLSILQPGGRVLSLVGPPDAAFARARNMNVIMTALFGPDELENPPSCPATGRHLRHDVRAPGWCPADPDCCAARRGQASGP